MSNKKYADSQKQAGLTLQVYLLLIFLCRLQILCYKFLSGIDFSVLRLNYYQFNGGPAFNSPFGHRSRSLFINIALKLGAEYINSMLSLWNDLTVVQTQWPPFCRRALYLFTTNRLKEKEFPFFQLEMFTFSLKWCYNKFCFLGLYKKKCYLAIHYPQTIDLPNIQIVLFLVFSYSLLPQKA